MIKRLLMIATVAVGIMMIVSPSVYADAYLCNAQNSPSFYPCINAGYTAHGYEGYNFQSYWNSYALPGGHNCTNYVGYMLAQNGDPGHGVAMGNAGQWDDTINANPGWGYLVNNVPSPGSIALWDNANNGTGHVAYVEAVNGATITISEDNAPVYNSFRWRTIDSTGDWPSKFLHITDSNTRLTQLNSDSAGWQTWDVSSGHQAIGTPLALWGSGILDVYTVNSTGGLDQYHQDTTTGVWSVYTVLTGTNFTQGVTGVLDGATLNLFIPDTSGRLHHVQKPVSGGWGNYTLTNSGITSNNIYGSPGVLWTSGSVSVFGVNQSGNLLQYYVPQGQTNWAIYNVAQPSPALSGGVSVFLLGGMTYVHMTNINNRLIEATATSGGWVVASVSQAAGSTADVTDTPGVIYTPTTIDLFPRGTDGSLHQFHVNLTGGGWSHYTVRPALAGIRTGTHASMWGNTTEVFAGRR